MPQVFSRRVHSNKIVFFDQGKGSVLVLIHGMFGDHLDWEPVLAPLAKCHRVIAVDLPGFGGSDKPARQYTAEFFVDTLHDLLLQLEVARATLVGNSFGGQIAMLYTLRHPQKVERLILVGSMGLRQFSPEEQQAAYQRLSEAVIAALTPEANELMFAPIFAKASENRLRYLQKQNAKLKWPDYPAYVRCWRSYKNVAF